MSADNHTKFIAADAAHRDIITTAASLSTLPSFAHRMWSEARACSTATDVDAESKVFYEDLATKYEQIAAAAMEVAKACRELCAHAN